MFGKGNYLCNSITTKNITFDFSNLQDKDMKLTGYQKLMLFLFEVSLLSPA